jgi:AcrR family transcriptional regulator
VLAAATAVFLDRGYSGATMRAVAAEAAVSVPTVEALFATKAGLLKAAIDVAIAGDDEVVPVLDRAWASAASEAASIEEFLSVVAGVLAAAQQRSAGLVLAVFEGAAKDAQLAELARQMTAQRAATAGWIVDGLTRRVSLRAALTTQEAVDSTWVLMDPAIFDRLTRQRHWTLEQYQRWFANSLRRLLTPDRPPPPSASARLRRSSR